MHRFDEDGRTLGFSMLSGMGLRAFLKWEGLIEQTGWVQGAREAVWPAFARQEATAFHGASACVCVTQGGGHTVKYSTTRYSSFNNKHTNGECLGNVVTGVSPAVQNLK